MDFYGSVPSALSIACSEIRDKMASDLWSGSPLDLALLVVQKLFNNSQVDLLSVFQSSCENEFEQTIDLIGTSSSAFKALIESYGDQTFEHFIESFCKHLEHSRCDLPPRLVDNSVYMYLLADYVCFMMPIDSLDGSREYRTEMPTKGFSSGNICISSPLRLFNEDALQRYSLSPTKNSLQTLHSFSQSLSPHFVSFICIVVKTLCSLAAWPSEYRLNALRYVVKQYHLFVLARSDSGALAHVKSQLLHNPPFVDHLYDFLCCMFTKWPDTPKFAAVFGKMLTVVIPYTEVWLTWIRPWRYSQEDSGSETQRMQSFIECNRRFYVDLTDAFFQRSLHLDNPESVLALRSYLAVIVSEPLQKAYRSLDYDLEGPIMKVGVITAKWADYSRRLIADKHERLKKQGWFSRLVNASENEAELRKLNATVTELDSLAHSIADAGSTTTKMLLSAEAIVPSYVLDKSPQSFSSTKPIPDHYVDSRTKFMRLTDLGRKQIRRGTHRFDLSRCLESVPPLLAPRRSDEVWWLAKLLYRLSCFMNQTALIIHLSHTYYDCSFTGMVARRILDPAYPHTVVPAFSKTVFVMKPAINFRRFAQYKYVAPTCVFIILIFFLPFRFAFAVFFPFIVLAALS
ncbi:unnamed protein product [Toxocara canis]|uniref:Sphingomyelin phosphodiesterase 4 n=1 Tax=Toxocara canis TaxID=6265 RepID=A0A183V1Z3_TOXCA|nr:unnamed protein product [Toxocara canis]